MCLILFAGISCQNSVCFFTWRQSYVYIFNAASHAAVFIYVKAFASCIQQKGAPYLRTGLSLSERHAHIEIHVAPLLRNLVPV